MKKKKIGKEDLLKHSIYNYQINDYGYANFGYSFRSIYDTLKIIDKNKIKKLKVENTKELIRYFDIIKELKIFDSSKIGLKSYKSNIIIFNFFKTFTFIRVIFVLLNKVFLKINELPSQLKFFIKNKEYRKHLVNKLFKKKLESFY